MRPAPVTITLSAENSKSITKYATLAGQTLEKFLNGFLKHFLADAYLGRFTFKTRGKAEQLAAWMQYRFFHGGKTGSNPASEHSKKVEIGGRRRRYNLDGAQRAIQSGSDSREPVGFRMGGLWHRSFAD